MESYADKVKKVELKAVEVKQKEMVKEGQKESDGRKAREKWEKEEARCKLLH